MFLNQNTIHQTTQKCFGIKTQHIKHLRNVLEWEYNTSNNCLHNIYRTKKDRNIRHVEKV